MEHVTEAGRLSRPAGETVEPAIVEIRRLVRGSPAFASYLLALAVLPIRWLSPLGSVSEHGGWSDLLIAAATALWAIERGGRGELRSTIRRWQLPLFAYVGLGVLSAAAASPSVPKSSGTWTTVLLMAELVALGVITADFAADPTRRRLIARVIVASALGTVALGVVGLILFYAGIHSGLIGGYGQQYIPSHLYARVQAGFESPPLLASFCIFASGVVASPDAGLGRRTRLWSQVALGLLCAATLSRGLIGFLLALMLRWAAAMPSRRRAVVSIGATVLSLLVIGALSVGRLHLDPAKPSTISYVVPDPGNRREAFVTSWHTFEHHPLLGIGPGGLPGVNAGIPFRAHFTPLNVAATLGLPALLALVASLFFVWRDRRRPTDVALWSAAAGVALDGLAQDIDHFRHIWVLIGLLGSGRQRRSTR